MLKDRLYYVNIFLHNFCSYYSCRCQIVKVVTVKVIVISACRIFRDDKEGPDVDGSPLQLSAIAIRRRRPTYYAHYAHQRSKLFNAMQCRLFMCIGWF